MEKQFLNEWVLCKYNRGGQYANEEVFGQYVENQGKEKEYKRVYVQQLISLLIIRGFAAE
jgi:hypothetical protein